MQALSDLMIEKLTVIKEHKIIECKKYPWYDPTAKKLSSMYRWSYPNVKTVSTPDGTIKLGWEVDAQTVKALERRGLLKVLSYEVGVRGKFPNRYEAL